jgi:hypothetical protein
MQRFWNVPAYQLAGNVVGIASEKRQPALLIKLDSTRKSCWTTPTAELPSDT